MASKWTALATGTPDSVADWISFVDVSDTSMAVSGTNKKVLQDNLRISMANGATGFVQRTLKAKLGERISVKDFGGIGDGSTNDTAALSACINACNNNASVLDLSGGTWRVTGALPTITHPFIMSDGTGEIYVDHNSAGPILDVAPPLGEVYTVTAIAEVLFDFAGAFSNDSPVTRLTLSLGGGQSMPVVGSIGKLTATNQLNGVETGDQAGQHCYIAAVSGSFVYIPWDLHDTYTTSMQLVMLSTKAVVIGNFRMRANWDALVAGDWRAEFIRITGAINPLVEQVSFRDGAQGLSLWGTYGAITNGIRAHHFRNAVQSEVPGVSGYGVVDGGSWGSTHFGIGGTDCRHVYTTISPDAASNARVAWGRTFSPTLVGGHASGCSSAAYDTHSDAVDPEFIGMRIHSTYYGESSGAHGFQFRGVRGRMVGCRVRGGATGFQLYKQFANEEHFHTLIDCSYEGEGTPLRVEHEVGLTGSDARQTVRVRDFHGRTSGMNGIDLEDADLQIEGTIRIEQTGSVVGPRAIYMRAASTAESVGNGRLLHDCSAVTGGVTPRVITFEGPNCGADGLDVTVKSGAVVWQAVVSENDDPSPAVAGTFRVNCDADTVPLTSSGGYSEFGPSNLLTTGALRLRLTIDGGGQVAARTAGFNVKASDHRAIIPVTAAVSATVPSVDILGPYFECWIQAIGVTVTINGPGATNVSLTTGRVARVYVLNGQTYAADMAVTQIS